MWGTEIPLDSVKCRVLLHPQIISEFLNHLVLAATAVLCTLSVCVCASLGCMGGVEG